MKRSFSKFKVPRRTGENSSDVGNKNQSNLQVIRAKKNSKVESSAQGEKNDSEKKVYTVLFCKNPKKKRKSWEDGILVLVKKHAILYDLEGKVLKRSSRTKAYENLDVGSILEDYNRLLEVVEEKTPFEFDSGNLFITGGSSGAKNNLPVPVTISGKGKTCENTFQNRQNNLKRKFQLRVRDQKNGQGIVVKNSNIQTIQEQPKKLNTNSKLVSSSTISNFADKQRIVLYEGNDSLGTVSTVVDPLLGKVLREHQIEGVRFMFNCVTGKGADVSKYLRHTSAQVNSSIVNRGCILADEMGLGKTLQSITLLWTMLKQGPVSHLKPWASKAVVIAPSSLVKNWAAEIQKWLGSHRINPIVISSGGKTAKENVNEFALTRVRPLLIIGYEMYRKYSKTLNAIKEVGLIICDEGHRLKCAAGNQTIRALKAVKTLRRVLLTGTPVQNNFSEFFSMVDFINPHALGMDSKAFKRIFQDPIEAGTDKGASFECKSIAEARSKQLQSTTQSFILRRTAEVNQKFLKERTDISIFVKLSAEQIVLYENMVKKEFYSGGDGACALQMITKLRKLCTCTSLITDKENDDHLKEDSDLASLGKDQISLSMSGKLKLVMDLLHEMFVSEDDERIVLVSNSTKTLTLIQRLCSRENYPTLRLDGATPAEQRQRLVDRFNSRWAEKKKGNAFPFVFLLSAKAGGCGLNLIGANRLILMDPDWNPAVDSQASARIWRDGQDKPVFIYRLLATGTIEERVFQRQIMKLNSAQGVLSSSKDNGRKESLKLGKFSKQEIKSLFEYQSDTRCNTYDLMRKVDPENPQVASCDWEEYISPECIPDEKMKRAVENAGSDIVSWVNVQPFQAFNDNGLDPENDNTKSTKTPMLSSWSDYESDGEAEMEF